MTDQQAMVSVYLNHIKDLEAALRKADEWRFQVQEELREHQFQAAQEIAGLRDQVA